MISLLLVAFVGRRPVAPERRGVLVLADDDRGFSDQERQALIDSYPGARVHTFTRGGHLASFSRQGEFDALVDRFLKDA